jgi:tagatose 1,6-diphosphate aldolase GatY/KbaY
MLPMNSRVLSSSRSVLSVSRSHSSLMAQIHPSSLVFGGSELLTLLSAYRHSSAVPVAIHLDHITDERHLYAALDMKTSDGKPLLDSVMVDGSALPLEQNILWTKKMASYAHQRGVVVEAELGRLAGEEVDLLSPHSTSPVLIASQDGLSIPDVEAKMTDPAVVEEFLTRTQVRWDLLLFPFTHSPSLQVDLLAVTIGNVHGKYARPPALDFDRMKHILRVVQTSPSPTVSATHLVLHGASGLPSELIHQAIVEGQICKLNVNTDLRTASLQSLRRAFREEEEAGGVGGGRGGVEVLALMRGSYEAMKTVARDKITLFRHSA